MENKVKTIIMILLVIIIAILLTWISYILIEKQNIKMANSNQNKNEVIINNIENNISSQNTIENKQDEIEKEDIVQNKPDTKDTTEEEKLQKATGLTNEEKAVSAVKTAWGSEDGVYFSCMGIDADGRYIVTVNDSSTSAVYGWYNVNIQTGEVIQREGAF